MYYTPDSRVICVFHPPLLAIKISPWKILPLTEWDYDEVRQIFRECFPLDYTDDIIRMMLNGTYKAYGYYYYGVLTSLIIADVRMAETCEPEVSDFLERVALTFPKEEVGSTQLKKF